MSLPCTSDPAQESAMQKILKAAEMKRLTSLYQTYQSGLMKDEQTQKNKRFKEKEPDRFTENI